MDIIRNMAMRSKKNQNHVTDSRYRVIMEKKKKKSFKI